MVLKPLNMLLRRGNFGFANYVITLGGKYVSYSQYKFI